MISFSSFQILQSFIRVNYKNYWSSYEPKSGMFYDNQQQINFIEDLKKFNFLTEIKVAESNMLSDPTFAEDSQFLLDNISLENYIKDFKELKPNQLLYELLTVDGVSKLLKVTRPTVYKLIKDGKLKTVNVLSRKRILFKEYLNYISSLDDSTNI